MNDETALEVLTVLKDKPGTLRLVTNERSTVKEKDARPQFTNPLADPRLWVVHDVVAIDGPDAQGFYTARTEEGDLMVGRPAALLRRLTEAGQGE